jgi:dipeptidyl aminopeptidase/acylaminoacyl peptidase
MAAIFKKAIYFCFLPIFLVSVSSCASRPAKLIPLRDFFRNPQRAVYRISPDGKHLAFLKSYQRRLNLFVRRIGSAEEQRITAVTDRDISDYFWKGNDHLIYLKDLKGDENYHLYITGRSGGASRDLTPFPGVKAEVIDDLPDDDRNMIIGLNRLNREVFDAYRVTVPEGIISMIAKNPGNIVGWGTDHKGKLRLAYTSEGLKYRVLYRKSEADPFRPVLTVDFRDDFSPLFFTFDDRQLYAVSNLGRDRAAAVRFDPESAREVEVLFERPDVDIDGLSYSRKRKVLLAAFYTTWKSERKFFDKEIERYFDFASGRLKGYELRFVDSNKNEDVYIVRTSSDRSLGSYYLYEAKENKLTKLADISPWLDENELARMEPVSYLARDGLKINGYLTLPKGIKPRGLPVVILPHGGPQVRDKWGYDPEVQFLANRGYAVLQMNYRGSTGYGKKFEQAGFKQWGLKMQDDITDGVKWLVQKGIADPQRVAIYGGSYGGYATLAGLAFTPDLYACGIDYVGISNLFTFLKTIPPYWRPLLKMEYERIGDPVKDKKQLTATSPVFHAGRIKAPLMVIQGARDPRVNINESDQIVKALRKRGIAVIYIVKENEGHGFSNEENRFEVYEAMEKFLSKYLK